MVDGVAYEVDERFRQRLDDALVEFDRLPRRDESRLLAGAAADFPQRALQHLEGRVERHHPDPQDLVLEEPDLPVHGTERLLERRLAHPIRGGVEDLQRRAVESHLRLDELAELREHAIDSLHRHAERR